MSTGKPLQPPPWESFDPSVNPAFKSLDKAEMEKLALAAIAEAQLFVSGPANKFATDQQRFLADAERRRIDSEASINAAPGGSEKQQGHIREWVEALIDLGQFETARYYDFEDKAALISEACQRPDDYDCGCEREKALLLVSGTEQTMEIELDRRVALKWQFDPYRGEVLTLWQCRHCRMLNAMKEPPARQARRESTQRQIEADFRRAMATGASPMMSASDVVFLKAS